MAMIKLKSTTTEDKLQELEQMEKDSLELMKEIRLEIHKTYKKLYQEYVDSELSNRLRKQRRE
jgi:hypothetical protein